MLANLILIREFAGCLRGDSTASSPEVCEAGFVTSPLTSAVCALRPDAVKRLLMGGVDPNTPWEDGTVLHLAASNDPRRHETEKILRLLVRGEADLEAKDREGATALHIAVRMAAGLSPALRKKRGDAWFQRLLGDDQMDDEWKAVLAAIQEEEEEDEDDSCETAAELEQRLAAVKTLLDLGADIDAPDRFGGTPADLALRESDVPLVEALVRRNARSNGFDGNRLLVAARAGELAAVEDLLARGVAPDRRFVRCGTPLSEAAGRGHVEIVQLLLDRGADPNLPESGDSVGDWTPLFRAVSDGHREIAEALLRAGADPYAPGPLGEDLFDRAKQSAGDARLRDRPWDELLADLREARSGGPPRVELLEPVGSPPLLRKIAGSFPALESLGWKAAEVQGLTLLESGRITKRTFAWDAFRRLARHHGFSPVLVAWSIEDIEPAIGRIRRGVRAIRADLGEGWLGTEIANLRRIAAEEILDEGDAIGSGDGSTAAFLEELKSLPIPRAASQVSLPLEGYHLVLLEGAPETALVLYQFGHEDLEPAMIASVLSRWRAVSQAELTVIGPGCLELLLPEPLVDERVVRDIALEIWALAPDLAGPREILALAGSRQWSLWWD